MIRPRVIPASNRPIFCANDEVVEVPPPLRAVG
jgi:hypothetical protein